MGTDLKTSLSIGGVSVLFALFLGACPDINSDDPVTRTAVFVPNPATLCRGSPQAALATRRSSASQHLSTRLTQPQNNSTNPLRCGSVISENMDLTEDLDCSNETGAALYFVGDGITLDGQNHRIIAPNSRFAVLASGPNLRIQNITIENTRNGPGLLAFNTPNIFIQRNTFRNNLIGLQIFAEEINVPLVTISSNNLSSNSEFAIAVGQSGTGAVYLPSIQSNDLSLSGQYAIAANSNAISLRGADQNIFAGSNGGIYLSGGNAEITGFDFSNEGIPGAVVFASDALSVHLSNSTLSSSGTPSSQNLCYGAHLYRVKEITVQDVSVSEMDVGIKLATDSGISPNAEIAHSSFVRTTFAGLWFQSYDNTPFGTLLIHDNDLRLNPEGRGLYFSPNTPYGVDSVFQNNLF